MSFDKYQLKEKSHRIVFNTIRQHEEISGADISRKTTYQPSTISYILKKLEKEKLIQIARIGLSQGSGKPPTLWRVSENLGYIIGLECLPNEFRLSILDVSGKIISQDKTYFNFLLNNQNLPSEIKKYVEKVLKDNSISLKKCWELASRFLD